MVFGFIFYSQILFNFSSKLFEMNSTGSFAYNSVVLMDAWPIITWTTSLGTSCPKLTVLAKVWRATCDVRGKL